MERLHKFLSRAGIASRRTAEQMIVDGKVKVNGQVVTTLGTRVDPDKDLVVVAGQPAQVSSQRKYFLFYKPPGVVTTLSDPQGRPTIADFTKFVGSRIFPVGRLDFDAEGALLLTDDGDLANKLMHPSHEVPRVYLAKVKGSPDRASLDKLLEGVRLEDGMARATEASVFEKAEVNTWIKLVVTEGRQHLVKRLCAAIGHPVVRLFRPSHAGLPVQGMKPGELRELSFEEVKRVKILTEGGDFPQPPLALPARRHGHGVPGLAPAEEDEGSFDAPAPRQERAERPQRGERPERAARPDRAERPKTAAKPALPEKEKGGKVYSGDRNPSFTGEQKTFDREPFRAASKAFEKPHVEDDEDDEAEEVDDFPDRTPQKDAGAVEERKPRREPGALGDRKPRNELGAFRDRKPRSEPGAFGDRKPRSEPGAFGDRRPRSEAPKRFEPGAFGNRMKSAPRAEEGAGDRKPAWRGEGKSFGDRKPAFRKEGKSFGDRKPASRAEAGEGRSFGDRKPAFRKEGGKPFGDRKPGSRAEGAEGRSFGDRKPAFRKEGGKPFGDRKPGFRAEGGGEGKPFGDRKPSFRKEGKPFGDRKPGGGFKGKPGAAGRFAAKGGKGRAGSRSSGPKRDSGRGKPRGSW
jgi:23S rRNA pseudouridine2605 synthase